MPNFLLRDLKPGTMESLRVVAASHGRSLQAEIQAILDEAAERDSRRRRFAEHATALSELTDNATLPDLVEWIREDRDSR